MLNTQHLGINTQHNIVLSYFLEHVIETLAVNYLALSFVFLRSSYCQAIVNRNALYCIGMCLLQISDKKLTLGPVVQRLVSSSPTLKLEPLF